jgi:hypothetical protein
VGEHGRLQREEQDGEGRGARAEESSRVDEQQRAEQHGEEDGRHARPE